MCVDDALIDDAPKSSELDVDVVLLISAEKDDSNGGGGGGGGACKIIISFQLNV